MKKIISSLIIAVMLTSGVTGAFASPNQVIEAKQVIVTEDFETITFEKDEVVTTITFNKQTQTYTINVVDKETEEVLLDLKDSSADEVMSQLQKESTGRQKRAVFLIPLAWGAAEIAAFVAGGVAAVTAGLYVGEELDKQRKKDRDFYLSTKQEIEDAADDIPKKLKKKNDDYSVDVDKFTEKVIGERGTYKDPKTGWTIQKTRGTGGDKVGHKGDVWKLRNFKGKRIASLTKEGKIVGQ
ncbi:glucuronyl hydrolase [Brevibacillus laterosporus]|uniref:glucuronyl hydrolase n=1 Tax=Brevibacillus laterosporus TaxID=1465 RepID=UPI001A7EBBCB|nr:glucuronyl hydrolase [Brevibacillus laterosporus]MCR8938571.1 glucuronyl hydrolase [Brevibacillus laterosporus]MCZ0841211.1 glucuronyl hydrolase [Brevibacillus laterosporus]MCZ0845159.1 glucuronyl hydrolase [Brevibacillus laterosporus]MED1911782.1 glucuronyl hydrolase [Brevibacillus laterosporus]